MKVLCIFLFIIIILGLIGIYYAHIYNIISTYKLKIDKAENSIDDALRNKYDNIMKANIIIKKIIPKKDYLKEFTDLKEKNISNYELDRKLTEAENLILELKNDYSKLNEKDFNKILKEIYNLNETLVAGKNYYNKNTAELNKYIRKFPSNIVAKIHHYKIKPFFDGKNMQDEIVDDFKL